MSRSVAAVLAQRLSPLRERLPGALAGEQSDVHEARVASRRLRELLPLLVVVDRRDRVARAKKAIRHVTRALGPVREIDVALGNLDEHAARHPEQGSEIALLRRWLEERRATRREELCAALDEGAVASLWRRIEPLAALAEDAADAEHAWRRALARRIRRRGGALRVEVEKAGVLYDAAPLHAVRIATKKLRYGIELAGALRLAAVADVLRSLKRQQELLGRIHDLEVWTELATRATGRVDALHGVADSECRALHARYLRTRVPVLHVTDLAGSTLATQVAGPGAVPSPRRVASRPAATPAGKQSVEG